MDVCRAGPGDWDDLRAIRLRSLRADPQAFGATYAAEAAWGDFEWRRFFTAGPWFLARRDDRAVGVTAVLPGRRPGERHLIAMWVEPGSRGRGIGAALVAAATDWARGDGADVLTLWVADGNPGARGLYERLDFRPTGVRQALPSNPAVGEDEFALALGTPGRT